MTFPILLYTCILKYDTYFNADVNRGKSLHHNMPFTRKQARTDNILCDRGHVFFLSTLIMCTIISKTIPIILRLFYSVNNCMILLFHEMYTNMTHLINMNRVESISISFSIAGCHCVP